MMKIKLIGWVLVLWAIKVSAQTEGLTSSPYSLYGLGVINQTTIGGANGMGYTGIAMKSTKYINNLNPANFSLVPKNSFLYDVGLRAEYNTYSNKNNNEGKANLNFSNLAFAFSLTDDLGMGLSMIPYSDVGYSLVGIKTNIEGSTETFESNVTGIGGLSDLRLNLGYALSSKIRTGASMSFMFGSIEEEESFTLSNSAFQLNETTNYKGVRLGFGVQYDLTDKITFGSTVQLPTSLSGSLKRSVSKSLGYSDVVVEEDEKDDVSDFKLPMELGIGFSGKVLNKFTVNLDYKKNFWDATNQKENIGSYKDQNIYGFGAEYLNDLNGIKYWQHIRFRVGLNYDNGYLSINGKKIEGQSLTAGIGLPISRYSNSMLNFSYSYGSKGLVQNILIKENYHLLTFNLSLEDLWFVKRKIN